MRLDSIKKIGFLIKNILCIGKRQIGASYARERGYKVVYAPKAVIWHKISKKPYSPNRMYYTFRNKFLFMKYHVDKWHYVTFLLYYLLYQFWLSSFIALVLHRNYIEFKILLKATVDGIMIKPE